MIRPLRPLALLLVAGALGGAARAQELEPRAFSNAPVGVDFLVAGYGYSTGDLVFDPSLPVEDATATIRAAAVAYARTFALAGRTAKLAISVPWFDGLAEGLVAGEPAERRLQGFGDARVGLSWLFHGSPAQSLGEFARAERPPTVFGLALVAGVPVGEYDRQRLLNLGTNRWSLKGELGVTQRLGRWWLEGSAAATFFQDNDEFRGSSTREQEPVFSAQAHLVRELPKRFWLALDTTYYWGGQARVDGVKSGVELGNSRVGVTLNVPVSARQSMKVALATGISARTGTDFDSIAVAWQWLLPRRRAGTPATPGDSAAAARRG